MGDFPCEQEQDDPDPDFVEIDPTGRYGRYNEMVGKGAFKTVYKAFDVLEGIEVAWNQMKVRDVLCNSMGMVPLCTEVHLLETLNHKNIIKSYYSWIDEIKGNVNFITEICTSGNLHQYRQKHKYVGMSALKNWSRQILQGLVYLHSHNPPVIHRDLKCDNIFVNGNSGEIKIGDLGLAAILSNAHPVATVTGKTAGTFEFMAPELFEKEYNELVDVYAFGMCLLELVTFEYPYKECQNEAEIYNKIRLGIKPKSLSMVKDVQVKRLIEKCIANVSDRLHARELLLDPFLQLDAVRESIGYAQHQQLCYLDDNFDQADANDPSIGVGISSSSFIQSLTIQSQLLDDDKITINLVVKNSTGKPEIIWFTFDLNEDSAIVVASEMVGELDLPDDYVVTIAEKIDSEIQTYFPEWIPGDYGNDDNVSTMDNFESESEDKDSSVMTESDLASGSFGLKQSVVGGEHWFNPCGDDSNGFPSSNPLSVSSGCKSSRSSDELRQSDFYTSVHSTQGCHGQTDENSNHSIKDLLGKDHDDLNLGESPLPSRLSNASGASVGAHKNDASDNNLFWLGYFQNGDTVKQNVLGDVYSLFNDRELMGKRPYHAQSLMKRLEGLLKEQQRELQALKKKHSQALANNLKEIPPQFHSRILCRCQEKIPDNLVNNEKAWYRKVIEKSVRTIKCRSFPSYVNHCSVDYSCLVGSPEARSTELKNDSGPFFSVEEALTEELLQGDYNVGLYSTVGSNILQTKIEGSDVGIPATLRDILTRSDSEKEHQHSVAKCFVSYSFLLRNSSISSFFQAKYLILRLLLEMVFAYIFIRLFLFKA